MSAAFWLSEEDNLQPRLIGRVIQVEHYRPIGRVIQVEHYRPMSFPPAEGEKVRLVVYTGTLEGYFENFGTAVYTDDEWADEFPDLGRHTNGLQVGIKLSGHPEFIVKPDARARVLVLTSEGVRA